MFYNKISRTPAPNILTLPSSSLNVHSKEAYAVAALLGVSLFINTATALQTPSTYQCQNGQCTGVQEIKTSVLTCKLQPRTQLSPQKFIPFPPLVRDFTHPGVYSLNTGYTKEDELTELRNQDYKQAVTREGFKLEDGSMADQLKQLQPRWDKLYKTYLVDGHPCGNSCPLDRTHAEKAYDFAEKSLIPKSIHKLQCGDLIRLNAFFTGVARSSYRQGPITIFNTHNKVPSFFKIEEAEDYFKAHAAEDVESYQALKTTVKNFYGEADVVLANSWTRIINHALLEKEASSHYQFLKKYYDINILSAQEISIQMNSLLNAVKKTVKKSPIEAAALLHMGLVNIHPFVDANGRTARLAANIILIKAGYPAIAFTSENRYSIAVYNSHNTNDVNLFARYLEEEICRTQDLLKNPELQESNILRKLINSCKISDCTEQFKEAAKKYNF